MKTVQKAFVVGGLALALAGCGAGSPANGDGGAGGDGGAPPPGGENSATGAVGSSTINVAGASVARVVQSGQKKNLQVKLHPAPSPCGAPVAYAPGVMWMELYVLPNDGAMAATRYDRNSAHIEAYVRYFVARSNGTCYEEVVKNDGILDASVTLSRVDANDAAGTFEIQMYNAKQEKGTVRGSFSSNSACAPGMRSCMK